MSAETNIAMTALHLAPLPGATVDNLVSETTLKTVVEGGAA